MSLAEQIMPEDYIFPPKPAPLNEDEISGGAEDYMDAEGVVQRVSDEV